MYWLTLNLPHNLELRYFEESLGLNSCILLFRDADDDKNEKPSNTTKKQTMACEQKHALHNEEIEFGQENQKRLHQDAQTL